MLDIIGNEKDLGKAIGADENKNTFVQLYGLEKCDEMVKSLTEQAISNLSNFNHTAFMMELANYLTARTK
jgi:geranylgeranyl diphosphate synthase type II